MTHPTSDHSFPPADPEPPMIHAAPTTARTAAAVVVPRFGGYFSALITDGPDAGRQWALEGQWRVGSVIQVRYHPEDQFATPTTSEGTDP